jgi:hypothetical protein
MLNGIHFGCGQAFGFIYFERQLGAGGLLLGLCLTTQAAIEVPLFRIAPALVRRMGTRTALLTCMLAGAYRFGGEAAARHAWQALPFEAGHGWSFAVGYVVRSVLSETYGTPLGLSATIVGLISTTEAFGGLIAIVGGGLLTDVLGLRRVFGILSGALAVAALPLLWYGLPSVSRAGVGAARCVLGRRRGGDRGGVIRFLRGVALRSDAPHPS